VLLDFLLVDVSYHTHYLTYKHVYEGSCRQTGSMDVPTYSIAGQLHVVLLGSKMNCGKNPSLNTLKDWSERHLSFNLLRVKQ
jgi:hypothetical protein